MAAVLAAFGSWRAAYWCVGGVGIALAAVFIAASFRADAPAAAAAVSHSPVTGKPSFAEAFRAVFACPTAVIAAAGHATFTFVVFGYTAWAPKYVALKFGISPGSAAFGAMFWHFSAACAAVLAAGFVTDRFVGRFPRFRLALQTCSLLAAVPPMFAFASGGSLCSVWTAAALLGVMKGAFEANSVNSMFDVVPRRCHSSAVGYMNVMSGVFGAFAPMTLGWLSQRSGVRGLELGFSSFGFVLLAAGILMGIAALRTFGRDRLAVLNKDK